jgi:hypothetical protein
MSPARYFDRGVNQIWLEMALNFANQPDDTTDSETAVLFRFVPMWHPPRDGYGKLRREWRKILSEQQDTVRFQNWCMKNSAGLDMFPRERLDNDAGAPGAHRVMPHVNRAEFILAFVGFLLLLKRPPFEVRKCGQKRHGKNGLFFSIKLNNRGKGAPAKYCPQCIAEERRTSDDNCQQYDKRLRERRRAKK